MKALSKFCFKPALAMVSLYMHPDGMLSSVYFVIITTYYPFIDQKSCGFFFD